MKTLRLAFALTALVTLTACTSDDNGSAPPTSTAQAEATATRPAPSATSTPALPPVDGTVDPLGFGGTDPVVLKSNPDPISGAATLRAVRVGSHPEQGGWDRIVFEFADVRPAGEVRYVQQAADCGSGMVRQLPGTAILLVQFEATNAHTEAGQPTVMNRDIAGPGGVIQRAVQICDFEAHVDWALGLRSQQRFKVTTLFNPTRVVIDIKWP
jgi:hypothetical protein